jgi:photosystem II stability/assembly factor-like uncharacterized protein
MEFEPVPLARVGRAVALMAASLVAIAVGGVAYLHPSLPVFTARPALHAPYRIGAVDFVTPETGWVVADSSTGNYALLNTTDGGLTWTAQLSAPAGGNQEYLKFFDEMNGVFALVGTRPILERTSDGGRTWTSIPALGKHSTVLSWSFVDSDYGWMLADAGNGGSPELYGTIDRGWTWRDLGSPVTGGDEAFGARFSFLTTGWLASAGAGPYAYKSIDFGASWSRIELPLPEGATIGEGRFFVDAQQTSGGGVIASVVYFPYYLGRGGASGRIRQFPPLPVPFYDGSRPNNYVYSTMIDQVIGAPNSAVQAPVAELLRSLDGGATWVTIQPPALSGTLGYASKSTWWWVDRGHWSSTADGGLTWARETGTGLLSPLPGSLQMLDGEHAWFAAAGAPALQSTSDAGRHWRLVVLPTL